MSITVKSRKDGSIGLPASLRRTMRTVPGSTYVLNYDPATGCLNVHPFDRICGVCGSQSSAVSPLTGYCSACEAELVELTGKYQSISRALKVVLERRAAKTVTEQGTTRRTR